MTIKDNEQRPFRGSGVSHTHAESLVETYKHIETVRTFLHQVIEELLCRSLVHDQSKLESPEAEIFAVYTPKLAGCEYGSAEYKGYLDALKPALEHHYAANSHHPEHGEPGLEWTSVRTYEGFYEISNYGDMRSITRTVSRAGPTGDLVIQGRDMTATRTPKGYLRIRLQRDGVGRNFMVHRLVAEAFLPNPDGKPEVNHKNGNKADNRASNLEWVTASENQVHAYDQGLRESNIKYVVSCPELDLTTFGVQAMERALRARGYEKASAAGIWGAMDRGGKHLDLTFEGTLLLEWRRSRILDMTLVDLTEMLCDWTAATKRHKNGSISRSIDLNQERFGYGDELKAIFHNTLAELRRLGTTGPG